MSPNAPFIFKAGPSPSSDVETAMPSATPSSLVGDNVFSFDFTCPLATGLPIIETSFTAGKPVNKQSCHTWFELEAAEPSMKKSRFNWSDIDFVNNYIFEDLTPNQIDSHSSIHDLIPGLRHKKQPTDCAVCSLVPYGAVCTKCHKVQSSKAITLATPPAIAWRVTDNFGDWEGSKALEENLLRKFDMDLFDLINVPDELDEWGRRVYNDSGDRILYYQDSDGNTVLGYEAWYPSSVLDDDDEQSAADWFAAVPQQTPDMAADEDRCTLDGNTVVTVTGYDEAYYPASIIDHYYAEEAYYPASIIDHYYDDPADDDTPSNKLDILEEQRRFADFLAAQDDELPQFSSDRERVAAWIAAACAPDAAADDDDDASVLDDGEIGSEWVVGFEGCASVGAFDSVSICAC